MFGILSLEGSYVQDIKKRRLLCSTRGPICSILEMVILSSGGCYVRLISLKPLYSLGFGGVFVRYNSNYNRNKKGYIIDLRSNPGGLLPNAIIISDMFLDGGVIVSTIDRDGYKETTKATRRFVTDKPIVILINKGSASASEIFSGAMKDNKRALLIGENTYGKGLVQEVNRLSGGSGANITIQKYLTPNGTDINKKGIEPDITVKLTEDDIKEKNDVQLKRANEVLLHMIYNN